MSQAKSQPMKLKFEADKLTVINPTLDLSAPWGLFAVLTGVMLLSVALARLALLPAASCSRATGAVVLSLA